jgi:hypothetical protein
MHLPAFVKSFANEITDRKEGRNLTDLDASGLLAFGISLR